MARASHHAETHANVKLKYGKGERHMAMYPTSGSSLYGARIGDYPGNPLRYLIIAFGVFFLFMGLTGYAFGAEWDTTSRWGLAILGIILFVVFYLRFRGAHAQLFEHGFVFARAGKVTNGRWEDITNITHKASRLYLLSFIPISGTKLRYTLHLRSGTTIDISDYYSNTKQMLADIQRKWRQAAATTDKPSAS